MVHIWKDLETTLFYKQIYEMEAGIIPVANLFIVLRPELTAVKL